MRKKVEFLFLLFILAWQTAKGTYVFRFCTSSADAGKEVSLKISKASEWKTGALLLPEE